MLLKECIRMRWHVIIIILLISLVACTPAEENVVADNTPNNGDGEATQEPSPEAFVVVTRSFEEPTAEGALEIAPPGTLVASETEDPDAGLVFDRVFLLRTGGTAEAPIRDEIEVFQNGQYRRNESTGVASTNRIARIDELIDSVNFFGLQGAMLGPSTETDDYFYRLTVERNGIERTIQSQDGFMPTEYMNLLGEILLVGVQQ
jgi:hypothetical protein